MLLYNYIAIHFWSNFEKITKVEKLDLRKATDGKNYPHVSQIRIWTLFKSRVIRYELDSTCRMQPNLNKKND